MTPVEACPPFTEFFSTFGILVACLIAIFAIAWALERLGLYAAYKRRSLEAELEALKDEIKQARTEKGRKKDD